MCGKAAGVTVRKAPLVMRFNERLLGMAVRLTTAHVACQCSKERDVTVEEQAGKFGKLLDKPDFILTKQCFQCD